MSMKWAQLRGKFEPYERMRSSCFSTNNVDLRIESAKIVTHDQITNSLEILDHCNGAIRACFIGVRQLNQTSNRQIHRKS